MSAAAVDSTLGCTGTSSDWECSVWGISSDWEFSRISVSEAARLAAWSSASGWDAGDLGAVPSGFLDGIPGMISSGIGMGFCLAKS